MRPMVLKMRFHYIGQVFALSMPSLREWLVWSSDGTLSIISLGDNLMLHLTNLVLCWIHTFSVLDCVNWCLVDSQWPNMIFKDVATAQRESTDSGGYVTLKMISNLLLLPSSTDVSRPLQYTIEIAWMKQDTQIWSNFASLCIYKTSLLGAHYSVLAIYQDMNPGWFFVLFTDLYGMLGSGCYSWFEYIVGPGSRRATRNKRTSWTRKWWWS